MNQFKPSQVLLLPTEKGKGSLAKTPKNSLYRVTEHNRYLSDHIDQHLYIISDDEIKEGDWKYNEKLNCITQHCRESKEICDKLKIVATWCKKIIATTDNSIYLDESESNGSYIRIKFPKPSQKFIEQYIESYNKGEVITDVLVEYELKIKHDGRINNNTKISEKLVVNKDNTINIKPIKDNWNREEVIYNVIKHRNEFLKFKTNSHYNPNDKEIKEWDNNWIKENL